MNLNELSKGELINIIESNEFNTGKYGLIWDRDKEPEEIILNCKYHVPVLSEIKDKNINLGSINNILIEGDNFHALSVLNYTHNEKVDVIYIDPPYNTGSKDFVYNDKFVDYEDGYRHSKWLNFMEYRLQLSRKLLTPEGVIFISIDDNEYAQLKLLCDKIFGEGNHLGTIIQNKRNAQNDAIDIQKNHEYILAYRKVKRIENGKELPTLINNQQNKKVLFKDEHGYYYKGGGITTGGEGGTLNRRPNLGYSIYYNDKAKDFIAISDYDVTKARTLNDEKKLYTEDKKMIDKGYVPIRPPKKGQLLGAWTWGIEKFNSELKNILITKSRNRYSVIKKIYVNDDEVEIINNKPYYIQEVEGNSKSIIEFSTSKGSTELKNVLQENKAFNNPKNHEMLKYLISLHPNKNATVLDFFAGSGTIGQAVLELNAEDDGNRKFILSTNNENDICEKVTYKRIYNVINGHENYNGIQSNLIYYKTDFVKNSNNRDQLYFDLVDKCMPMLQLKEDCHIFVDSTDDFKIYKNSHNNKYTCIYHSIFENTKEKFLERITEIEEEKAIYIFALGSEMPLQDFENVKNYKIEAIPSKITDLYNQIIKSTSGGNKNE